MGTVVASVRVADDAPRILLSEHLEGTTPVLVYRVADYDAAVASLRAVGVDDLEELGIPHGSCASFRLRDGGRAAVYQLTIPDALTYFDGRVDE